MDCPRPQSPGEEKLDRRTYSLSNNADLLKDLVIFHWWLYHLPWSLCVILKPLSKVSEQCCYSILQKKRKGATPLPSRLNLLETLWRGGPTCVSSLSLPQQTTTNTVVYSKRNESSHSFQLATPGSTARRLQDSGGPWGNPFLASRQNLIPCCYKTEVSVFLGAVS